MRPRLRLLEAALWVLGGGFFAQLVGGIVADVLRSLLKARGASAAQLDHSPYVVIPALVASSAALLLITVLAPHIAGVLPRAALGLRKAPAATYALAALGTVALGPVGDWFMRLIADHYPHATLGVVPMLNELVMITPLFIVWPAFALMPGIAEELAFRGLLQEAAGRHGVAILISGVAFALFHIDPHHVVAVLPLGIFLAWAGSRCGTYVTAFAHVVNNTVAITLVRIEELGVDYDSDQPVPMPWILASLVVVLLCTVGLKRLTQHSFVSAEA
jgi:membrane protease YdiL (CAAX protease family)